MVWEELSYLHYDDHTQRRVTPQKIRNLGADVKPCGYIVDNWHYHWPIEPSLLCNKAPFEVQRNEEFPAISNVLWLTLKRQDGRRTSTHR